MGPQGSTRFATILIAATVGLALATSPCEAQISNDEKLCRARLSKAMGKVVKAAHKAVTRCHKLRDKGNLSEATDCNVLATADSETKGRMAKAIGRLGDTVEASCTSASSILSLFHRCPAPNETLDDAGATTGIDDFDELQACLLAHLSSGLEATATDILGLPSGIGRPGSRCHGAIAKGLGRVLDSTIKERAKCQAALDKAGGPLDYACATFDDGRIAATVAKASAKVASACQSVGFLVGSCASNGPDIARCAIEEAAVVHGGGLAAMIWELPGVCPNPLVTVRIEEEPDGDEDFGARGVAHNDAPVSGYGLVRYPLSCDQDCANCISSAPIPVANSCRCTNDTSIRCTANSDCAGLGDRCDCYLGPPNPTGLGGWPMCLVSRLDGAIDGSLDAESGNLSLTGQTSRLSFIGFHQGKPCPTCEGGTCSGGVRDGLPCSADAFDSTYGTTSLDCLPTPGAELSGGGLRSPLNLTTGSFSLPFALPCDAPHSGLACACSTCSLDGTLACNSDSECATAAAGVCRTDGLHGGAQRRPNNCTAWTCVAETATEGICPGVIDTFCSGLVAGNGRGIIGCATHSDCEIYESSSVDPEDWACPGNDCGGCTITENRSCFLDPIEAVGSPGSLLVGGGCAPPSLGLVNEAIGLPGPFRVQIPFSLDTNSLCPDGLTPFEAPGGSNCP